MADTGEPDDPSLARAARALAAAGLPPNLPLERAASNANETWLAEGFVLRVNFRGDIGRLARETRIVARLPPEARHPGVIACGSDGEIEWNLIRRVRGVVLGRAWLDLDDTRRERATRELARALRALHAVDAPDLPTDDDLEPPHTLGLGPLLALIGKLEQRGEVEADLLAACAAHVRARWNAFDGSGLGLTHGDPHLENVLWDGDHVSALLDLEWARRSWLEGDLETLLSNCDHPWYFVEGDYEHRVRAADFQQVPGWLRSEYPALFANPRVVDRLELLHLSRTLGLLLEYSPRGPWDRTNPRDRRNHLQAVLDGTSHLHRFTDPSPRRG